MSSGNEADDKVVEENRREYLASKILISHGKEISIAVVIGVIITVTSSIILDYFFPEIAFEEKVVYLQSNTQLEDAQHHLQALEGAQDHLQSEVAEPSYRHLFVQSHLVNVISSLNPVKIQINTHFYSMGRFPTKEGDINLSLFDLDEHEQIDSVFMTDTGGVGVHLASMFGDEKYLILQPRSSKNGAFIKWRCLTNVEEKYLGVSLNKRCEFQESKI